MAKKRTSSSNSKVKTKVFEECGTTFKLTNMQRRFCLEYLKDSHAKNAAIRAGVSKKSAKFTAYRWLKTEDVRRYIRAQTEQIAAEIKVDVKRVLLELSRIAFFDATVFADIAEGRLNFEDLTFDERAAIAQYARTTTEFGESVRLKAHSKTKALELLANHLGMFEEASGAAPEEYRRPDSMREEE